MEAAQHGESDDTSVVREQRMEGKDRIENVIADEVSLFQIGLLEPKFRSGEAKNEGEDL